MSKMAQWMFKFNQEEGDYNLDMLADRCMTWPFMDHYRQCRQQVICEFIDWDVKTEMR